jgi:hypothetical protein
MNALRFQMVSLLLLDVYRRPQFFSAQQREQRKVRKGLAGNTFSHSGGGGAERCMAIFHSLVGVFVVLFILLVKQRGLKFVHQK